jgi:hypothetical protein
MGSFRVERTFKQRTGASLSPAGDSDAFLRDKDSGVAHSLNSAVAEVAQRFLRDVCRRQEIRRQPKQAG